MESIKKNSTRGRGRGILALTSYEPLPRPSKGPQTQSVLKGANGIGNCHVSKDIRTNVGIKKMNNLENLQSKNSDGMFYTRFLLLNNGILYRISSIKRSLIRKQREGKARHELYSCF